MQMENEMRKHLQKSSSIKVEIALTFRKYLKFISELFQNKLWEILPWLDSIRISRNSLKF